jgi:hypothetical protein
LFIRSNIEVDDPGMAVEAIRARWMRFADRPLCRVIRSRLTHSARLRGVPDAMHAACSHCVQTRACVEPRGRFACRVLSIDRLFARRFDSNESIGVVRFVGMACDRSTDTMPHGHQRRDQGEVMMTYLEIDAGLSQREAAKVLGVSKSALNRDVSRSGTKSGPKRDTKADRRAQRELFS